jgi:hypothetical protein
MIIRFCRPRLPLGFSPAHARKGLLATALLALSAILGLAVEAAPHAPAEMLLNGDFTQGQAHWESEQAAGATASINCMPEGPAGLPALHFKVLTIADHTWRLQWSQKVITITKGRPYVLTFWARAKQAGAINVTCMQNHAPWDHATQAKIELTTEWREYSFPFTGAWDDDNARISFTNLGTFVGQEYWFAHCSLRFR